MRRNILPIAFAAAIACATTAMATTYTWTGASATDNTDWNDATNWDLNGIPVDDIAGGGLSLPSDDKVVFAGATMPINTPGINSSYNATNDGANSVPVMEFNSGGSISFAHSSSHNNGMFTNLPSGFDRQIWTVGDGVSGGAEDVILNMTNSFLLMRHGNGVHRFTVNADGILNVAGDLDFQYNGNRYAIITIDGGAVNLTSGGRAFDLSAGNPHVEFTAIGGTFTASYGGSYADIAAVEASISPTGGFRSSDPFTIGVEATDNLDGTYTVTAVSEVTDEDISSGEFVDAFSFDGTDATFSFSVFDGSTYEIRRSSDLTLDLASWTTVYGPTASTLDGTIDPSDLASGLTDAFYILIITDTPVEP